MPYIQAHEAPRPYATEDEVFAAIQRRFKRHGYCPSIRDLCDDLGLKSTSTIHRWLLKLAERGLIRWEKGKNRAIEILDEGPLEDCCEDRDLLNWLAGREGYVTIHHYASTRRWGVTLGAAAVTSQSFEGATLRETLRKAMDLGV